MILRNRILTSTCTLAHSFRCSPSRNSSSLLPTISSALSSALSSSSTSSEAVPITISGWVRSCRRQKNVSFAVLNDGSDVKGIQAVLTGGIDSELTVGCSAEMTGRFVKSRGKGQEMEFQVDKVKLLGKSDAEIYPIPNTKQGVPLPILRRNAHLRPRTPSIAAMLRLRSELAWAAAEFFRSQDFVRVEPPLITSSDCEGAGEVFRVESGSPAPPSTSSNVAIPPPRAPRYLTVSSQLHLEAISSSLSRVWTLSPTFRAEESDTSRHLQEFYMLEAELSFLPETAKASNRTVMNVVEDLIRHVVKHVLDSPEVKYFASLRPSLIEELENLITPRQRWTRLTYSEAIDLLRHQQLSFPDTFEFDPTWGKALQTEHERWLAENVVRGPVFVTDYPKAIKPFYMLSNRSDDRNDGDQGQTVACFDLLVPRLGELVGGSVREHREEEMIRSMKEHGLNEENYEWYLELRRYGTTRHGGFGMGWERLIAIITGQDNVRECIAFPRAAEGSRF